ncbi:hypothetical protein COR50_18370 [Chitinophaga caeni]|uniref:RNA polymerase sigma-70 factor n=1 Tax=Chitinophaga caeni TaxID=2029983 RepID=A0A291QYD3_9BACT|nr:RNA polymerase sigma-70 factor [Chitinophaga caeni]ATL48976.1 hypothetical protein COR50_18370 [Chitinophaga caeni]
MGILQHKTDFELMELIKVSNKDAFNTLYDRFFKRLYYFTIKRTANNLTEAEDIVHDVFLKLWECRFKIENENISSFLYQCTINTLLNRVKKLKTRDAFYTKLALSYPKEENPIDHQILEDELKAKFDEAINLIPPKTREVFKLRYNAEMSYKEIAITQGVSIETVRGQIKKGLKTMRKHLRIFFMLYFF